MKVRELEAERRRGVCFGRYIEETACCIGTTGNGSPNFLRIRKTYKPCE